MSTLKPLTAMHTRKKEKKRTGVKNKVTRRLIPTKTKPARLSHTKHEEIRR